MTINRGVVYIGLMFGIIAFVVCLFFLPPYIALLFAVFAAALYIIVIGIVVSRATKKHSADDELIGQEILLKENVNYHDVGLVCNGMLYLTSDSLIFISHEKKPTLIEAMPLDLIKDVSYGTRHPAALQVVMLDGTERQFIGVNVRDFMTKINVSWDSTQGIFSYIKGDLGWDCWVINDIKDVSEAMERYEKFLALWKPEGCTPLIIVPGELLCEAISDACLSKDEIIERAGTINVAEFLGKRIKEAMPKDEDSDYDIMGEFAHRGPINLFQSLINSADCDLNTRALRKGVIIAKIPTDKPWELAAWIPMGGWNECPAPEEQVAVFKYWYEIYGAIPAVICEDIWEMYVERPPVTNEDAVTLALEQFGFCADIVWQGVEKVNVLASTLVASKVWYFWWD